MSSCNERILTISINNEITIPSRLLKAPDNRIKRRLRKIGLRNEQIVFDLDDMEEEETVPVNFHTDIIAPKNYGNRLRDFFKGENGFDWDKTQLYVKNAVETIIGEGRYLHNRRVFDYLVKHPARIAIIAGYGRRFDGEWALHDEKSEETEDDEENKSTFVCSIRSLLHDLELTPTYKLYLANIDNPTGYVSKVTQDSHLFYAIGDIRGNRSEINRQISDPVKRRR